MGTLYAITCKGTPSNTISHHPGFYMKSLGLVYKVLGFENLGFRFSGVVSAVQGCGISGFGFGAVWFRVRLAFYYS